MNKKLIFRILGAVSSALIIVSIFIPFISVSGYSQSLWEAYSNTNTLYLPIMIIVFGAIGVLFFSLNIKTEIAYSTAGALLFYLISETVSFIDQDMMKTLSVGYYCLVIGTILTGIMAFLSNLKTKQKIVNTVNQPENPVSIISQIDALYNNPNETQQQPIQPIPNMPMQVQSVGPIPEMPAQVQSVGPIPEMPMQAQPVEPIPEMPMQVQPAEPIPEMPAQVQSVGPIPEMPMQVQPAESIPEMPMQVQPAEPIPEMPAQVQSVGSIPEMPAIELNTTNDNINNSLNPVVAEFSNSIYNENPVSIEQNDVLSQTSNPVINEFNLVSNTVLPEAPVKVEPKVETTSNNLDIFN